MNLFALDLDPVRAAQALGDPHCAGKLLIECGQIVHAALYCHGYRDGHAPYNSGGRFAKWAAKSSANFAWVFAHAGALYVEKRFRFGGEHAAIRRVAELSRHFELVPTGPLTPFARSEACEPEGDAVEAYRHMYVTHKREFCVWERGRSAPEWLRWKRSVR